MACAKAVSSHRSNSWSRVRGRSRCSQLSCTWRDQQQPCRKRSAPVDVLKETQPHLTVLIREIISVEAIRRRLTRITDPHPLHWSPPSQEKRTSKLNVRFGLSDLGGERPVLTFTADSNGHLAGRSEQPLPRIQDCAIGLPGS